MDFGSELHQHIRDIRLKYEFLTFLLTDSDETKLGVIQNETSRIIMYYDLDAIETDIRPEFLNLVDEWWWQTNRKMPVDSYLGHRFVIFNQYLKGISKRHVRDLIGPSFNLSSYLKRTKEKTIRILPA